MGRKGTLLRYDGSLRLWSRHDGSVWLRPWSLRIRSGSGGLCIPEADASKVISAAKQELSKATTGKSWTAPNGAKLTPILVDNQIVGQLWQSADLKTLETGSYWQGPYGVRVQLLKNGEVVGMIWVKVS